MRPEEIPPELTDMLAAAAGRVHSRDGRVMTALAAILTRREQIRGEHLCGRQPSPGGEGGGGGPAGVVPGWLAAAADEARQRQCELPAWARPVHVPSLDRAGESGDLCGQSPRDTGDLPWLAGLECVKPAGHADGKPSERHEAGGFWRSERQQGHVHSTRYLCLPACPAYQGCGW